MIILVDDGTLDTVLKCQDCGHVERYSFAGDLGEVKDAPLNYEQHVRNCKEDFLNDHECPVVVVED